MKIISYSVFSLILLAIISCNDDDAEVVPPTVNNCSSSIPSYQDSVTVDSTTYHIIANYSSQKLIIETIGYTGQSGVSFAVNFLQVKRDVSCYESSASVEYTGNDSKVYAFNNVPSFANDTMATAYIKATINGNAYYLRDAKVNK